MTKLSYAIVCFPKVNVMQQEAIKLSFDRQYFIGEETICMAVRNFASERDGGESHPKSYLRSTQFSGVLLHLLRLGLHVLLLSQASYCYSNILR